MWHVICSIVVIELVASVPRIWSGIELMSAYADVIQRRFGDGGPSGEGVVENDFIRRVISRKTVRRYSDVIPGDGLLDLLVAAALSTSERSESESRSIGSSESAQSTPASR